MARQIKRIGINKF